MNMSDGPKIAASEQRRWVLTALDQYEGRLTRYALRLLGDLDLARDAVQHAFLKLCEDKAAGTFHVPCAEDGTRSVPTTNRLAAWLFTVCRNRATDLLRSHARERQAESQQAEQPSGHEADPAYAVEEADFAELLRRLIHRLPASQREAIDLWSEGFTYAEIARIVERHEGHVRVLVHRGLKALREHPEVRPLLLVDEDSSKKTRFPAPLGSARLEAPLH
jgi:RNA polymerase sigma factor (sigma-70 family)